MNANNHFVKIGAGLFLGLAVTIVAAEPLDATSTTKINNAKAKAWTDGSIKTNPAMQKDVVNIGSKRGGGCSDVNVGTAKAGEKAPKNIVVATKNVINVCK